MDRRSLSWISLIVAVLVLLNVAAAADDRKTTSEHHGKSTEAATSTEVGKARTTSSAKGRKATSTQSKAQSTVASSTKASSAPTGTGTTPVATGVATINSTILVFARDTASSFAGYSIFQGYDIPYEVVIVPSTGITLPQLNSSATHGNYGGIITVSEVSYESTTNSSQWASALTTAQWEEIYAYQEAFNVRLVRIDVDPSQQFGVEPADGGGDGIDQPVYFTDISAFSTSNIKTGLAANMSTLGLFHYPATILDDASLGFTTTEIARFGAAGGYDAATAAVINNFGSREQMVWFLPFAPDWSPTSTFLSHSFVHWLTRGLFLGFRRIYFNTQIDDMFLETDMYLPVNGTFTIDPTSIGMHIPWMADINKRMPAGSDYVLETGHNGNGNIETAVDINDNMTRPDICRPDGGIEYPDQFDTPLEFMKPPGTGTDIWPTNITEYKWSLECSQLDPLLQFWQNDTNFNAFYHISHTFTHEDEDNATYSDVTKEISWNVQWLQTVGFYDSDRFSPNGIIPPAITGLHNADALQAWADNGLKWVVGDNTRPVLMNPINPYWPLITNVSENGYAGIYIIGRWATTIYYNCDTPACTVAEWVATSAGTNSFEALLDQARQVNSWHLLGLHWDPFMFHQANLRVSDLPRTTINGRTAQYSLLQSWVETVVTEMIRLVDWPFITLKHDDICQAWIARMDRDLCYPSMTYTTSADRKSITAVTVDAADQNCNAAIPLTVPGSVSDVGSATTEQVGGDELTLWVTLDGDSQEFEMEMAVAW